MAVDTVEIQKRYRRKVVRAAKVEENETTGCLKVMGEKLEALLRELRNDREQRKQRAARRESSRRQKAPEKTF